MAKLTVRGTLVTVVFFAAVAVSSNVGQAPASKNANRKSVACEFRNTGVLMADGTDPLPGPSPIPWPKQSA